MVKEECGRRGEVEGIYRRNEAKGGRKRGKQNWWEKESYGRRQKKFPFTVRTTGRVIPFRSRLISVRLPFLSVFKPFPFCPKSSPSVLVNSPDGVIKHAQSLIALEGSPQFSDHDRARARAT